MKKYESKEFIVRDFICKENKSFIANSSENLSFKYNEQKELKDLMDEEGSRFLLVNKWVTNSDNGRKSINIG